MKKFGFGKKGGDEAGGGDDDASRSALFGRKKASASPATDNPYAQAPPANDPYASSQKSAAPANPYQQRPGPGFQNGPPRGPAGGLPGGPGPRRGNSNGSTYSQPPPPYGSPGPQDAQPPARGGYGSDRYGASGGYGDNRYDSGGGNKYGAPAAAPRGPGGYGGMGRTNSSDTDVQRDQLFSGAAQRQQNRQQEAGGPGGNDGGYGSQGGGGGDPYGGYGADRQLTEEEIEQQEVKNIKKQITDTRQESINSLQRSIALAHQAADTGINTMNILARDEERLNNTERRLDEAENYNKIGADRAKKLKHLNRSMFAVHVNNPFTSEKKQREREDAVMENHRQEREQRNATRKNAWDANSGLDDSFKNLRMGDPSGGQGRDYRPSAAESNKYVFTDDDDEENAQALEDETTINRQMGELSDAVGMLNRVAKAQGQTVQRQIVTADRINEKTDRVDDGVRLNRARLDRIR